MLVCLCTPCCAPAVCLGLPPDSLLGGVGSWPASCANSTFINGKCVAACPYGNATITCGNTGWNVASFTGRCSNSPGEDCWLKCAVTGALRAGQEKGTSTAVLDTNHVEGQASGANFVQPKPITIAHYVCFVPAVSFVPRPAACSGLPTSAPANFMSWDPSCASGDVGTVCYGTCKPTAVADDPPVSVCVDDGVNPPYWSPAAPDACIVGAGPPMPRVFLTNPSQKTVRVLAGKHQTCNS